MSRYLDPKVNLVFKKIFGEHPWLLKSFLNAILPLADDAQIESLEYMTTEQVPHIPTLKDAIVDVKCTDQKGRIFIVEMQMEWVTGFRQRMLYNFAHAYVKQLHVGEDFKSLCPVYGVGIVNQTFEPENNEWYHHYRTVNIQNPSKVLEGLELIFLELPKFKPTTREGKRLRILWLRFLSELNAKTKSVDAALLAVPEISEACRLSEESAFSEPELEAYHQHWLAVSTARTIQNGFYEKGVFEGKTIGKAEGKAEGLTEGKAIGRVEGFTEGKAIGKAEALTESLALAESKVKEITLVFAKRMLERGENPEDVASTLGLDISDVENLYSPVNIKIRLT